MVAEMEKWSQIWKKIGADLENSSFKYYTYMVPDLEKWSEMWKNGRRSGKITDLVINGCRNETIWSQIWKNQQTWKNGQRYLKNCRRSGKMVADLEKWSQIWKKWSQCLSQLMF